MNEPIHVETHMTLQSQKDFALFNMLKKGRHLKPAILFLLLMELLCIILSIDTLLTIGIYEDTALIIFMPIILVAFLVLMYILILRSVSKSFNTTVGSSGMVQKFDFYDADIVAETASASLSGQSRIQYTALYKAFELKDATYLYINSMQAYIISKNDMDNKTQSELSQLLAEKMGKKYIMCYQEKR